MFAVEDTAVQLVWRSLSGEHLASVGDVSVTVEGDGGPASVVVTGLPPASVLPVAVDGRPAGSATTLVSLPGDERCRIAVLSDLHVGEPSFGFWPAVQHPHADDPPNERCLATALAEALAWGAEAIVLKGDLTDRGRPGEWDTLAALLDGVGVPVLATVGNHDVKPGSVDGRPLLESIGVHVAAGDEVLSHDLDGLRVVLADSTIADEHHGRSDHFADGLAERLGSAPGAALASFHHQVLPRLRPLSWPPGMRGAHGLLDDLAAASDRAVLSTGHTHRHRRRTHRGLLVTETGSVKDHPGTWTGLVVSDAGLRQVTRRVGGTRELAWTDATATVFLGLWGHWSPGRLRDRCFVHRWP